MFILFFSLTGLLGFWLEVYYRLGGGRRFFYFVGFHKLLALKMSDSGAFSGDPKGKLDFLSRSEKGQKELEAKGHHFPRASRFSNDGNKPSEECKAIVFLALYEWFKETTFTNINRNFLALEEVVGKEVFLSHIWRLFEDAISRHK